MNRLCAQIADRYGWGIVNVNLRAYYGEGSKTVGFEVAEQLGWTLPRPRGRADGGRQPGDKVERAFRQLAELGLVDDAPVLAARRAARGLRARSRAPCDEGAARLRPVKPDTIVRSLAIGDPADGPAALAAIRRTGGSAARTRRTRRCSTASACWPRPRASSRRPRAARWSRPRGAWRRPAPSRSGRPVVLLITGHGLKTVEALRDGSPFAAVIDGKLDSFEAFWAGRGAAALSA